MKILPTLVLICLLGGFLRPTVAIQCNASHFNFIGNYTLGKQDELNRTFTKIQEKISSLQNVTYVATATKKYTIYNVNPSFYYRDSKQKSEIMGNDTIVISGGFLEVELTFNWTKQELVTTNGSGRARGVSDQIIFSKSIVIDKDHGFFTFDLTDFENVTWSTGNAINLSRIDPPDASDDDKANILKMLNNIMSVRTVRLELEEQIGKYYSYYLGNSLHDEHQPIDDHFDYTWNPRQPGRPNVTIPFVRRAITVKLETDGIRLTFENQVKNDTNWKCGQRNVPLLPLNHRVYGQTQQFISLDLYERIIDYAVQKDIFNTDLKRQTWQSRMFQFFAGDLYDIFPNVQKKFRASEPVTGNCRANHLGLKVWKAGFDTFNVSLTFDCQINIQRQKINDFKIALTFEIEGVPRSRTLDFRIRSVEENVTFSPYGDYQIQNPDLALAIIRHSLIRLNEGSLFGSGWPQSPPRDYPHFLVEQNYTIVYDSTHVDPHLA